MQQSLRTILIALLPLVLFAQEEPLSKSFTVEMEKELREQLDAVAIVQNEVNRADLPLTSQNMPVPTGTENFLLPEEAPFNSATLPLVPRGDEAIVFGESIQASPLSPPLVEPVEKAPVLKNRKSPSVAVLLSGLIPGLGHYYLGEPRVGSELLGSVLLGGAGAYAAKNDPALFTTGVLTVQGISLYSVYAAYRDAHLYNGDPSPAMPRDEMKDLAAAPFKWSVIKKPEVWGAFLGAAALGAATVYFAYPGRICARVNTTYVEPLSALPIAIGEESLFRGFLQTSLTGRLSPWGAIAVSSLAFGAAHIPNALLLERSERWRYYTFSLPFITSLGVYMGWLTHKNRSLKESVALHAWYDFALMSAGALAQTAAIGGKTQMGHSWEF